MNTAIQLFNYNENKIRITEINEEPWWVAKDICDVLEIQNTTQAIQALDEDERAMLDIGRQGSTNIINEPGLFQLIFKSQKPEAKAFKRFVCHEMLPQWRKHGFFIDKAASARSRDLLELEFKANAARARIEEEAWELKAQQVHEIEGAVPLTDWLAEHQPQLNAKQVSNLARTVKRVIAVELNQPVTKMTVPRRGKRLCARPEVIVAAMDLLNNRKELN